MQEKVRVVVGQEAIVKCHREAGKKRSNEVGIRGIMLLHHRGWLRLKFPKNI